MHIRPGRYRHYKGNDYLVLGIAVHSETTEPLVVYASAHDPEVRWARPYAMFIGWVAYQDVIVPRFMYQGSQ